MYFTPFFAILSYTLARDPAADAAEDCQEVDDAIMGYGERAYTAVEHALGFGRPQYAQPVESTILQSIAVATVTNTVQEQAQQTATN